MRVGIICAADTELAPFLPMVDGGQITERAMLKFYEGAIRDVEVVAVFSGVCKVNAAIAAQILIDTYHVDSIINAGVAGGMDSRLDIFDVAISTEIAYHDVATEVLTEFHPWLETVYFKADKEMLDMSKKAVMKIERSYKVFWGRMVTGEAFITDDGRQQINEHFAPLTVDMETASIAHVCHVNNIPFIAIRSVTDTETHSGSDYFEENCEKASIIAKDITVALLEEMRAKR